MMKKTARIMAGLGLLYIAVLRGASALAVGIRGYQIEGVDLSNGEVRIKLFFYIKNPLLIGVKLQGITGDVYMQSMKVGYVNSSYDYYLSGAKTHVVPVTVVCDIRSLGEAAVANIQSGNIQTLTVAFDGSIVVGSKGIVTIPIQKTLTWEDLRK